MPALDDRPGHNVVRPADVTVGGADARSPRFVLYFSLVAPD
jgi:hypothetical protein